MTTSTKPRPAEDLDAGTTDVGNLFAIDPDGNLQWICACGTAADDTITYFDPATEQTITMRVCGACVTRSF